MNIATIIILVLIAAGVFAAAKKVWRQKKDGCDGCTRNCCYRR